MGKEFDELLKGVKRLGEVLFTIEKKDFDFYSLFYSELEGVRKIISFDGDSCSYQINIMTIDEVGKALSDLILILEELNFIDIKDDSVYSLKIIIRTDMTNFKYTIKKETIDKLVSMGLDIEFEFLCFLEDINCGEKKMSNIENYEYIENPYRQSSYDKMSRKEARQNFKWFMENKEEIVKNISTLYYDETGNELDYSRDSLIGLWNWYLENVEVVDMTKAELRKEFYSSNELDVKHIVPQKVDFKWMVVARDIFVYLSECIIKNNPDLRWDINLTAKSYIGFNCPGIFGPTKDFIEFFPHTHNLMGTIVDISRGKKNKNKLIELFDLVVKRLRSLSTK